MANAIGVALQGIGFGAAGGKRHWLVLSIGGDGDNLVDVARPGLSAVYRFLSAVYRSCRSLRHSPIR